MDGFKETEIGLIPEDWKLFDFQETLLTNRANRGNQINASEIKSAGKFPVIDQGQEFIAGFCDDESKLFNIETPVIIFGDHTRCFKYVDFPFIIGADGTKVLNPNVGLFDPKFYYFCLLSLDIPSRGYNRHFKLLKERIILRPNFQEQRTIAQILSRIQDAIEKQEQIIKTTTELKKALMQKLFTEGLHGEPQKETEIGLIPESWDIRNINDFVLQTQTQNPKNEPKNKIKYIDVSSVSNQTFSVIGHQDCYREKAPGRARKVVYTNDVIFATIRPTLKRIAKIDAKYDDEYCSTAFCVLRPKKGLLDSEYLYQYLQTENFIDRISKLQSGASYPAVRNENVKSMVIPIPEIGEQSEIGNALKTIDQKIVFHRNRKQVLQSFFKSLLNQLMTGQIRVKDLEFDIEELEKRSH